MATPKSHKPAEILHLQPTEDPVDLYYEDVVVGQKIVTHSHEVTMAAVLVFAEVTLDQHPLHTSDEYARKTRFGRPIAHGLFALSLIEGLKAELKLYENTSIASLGWDKIRMKRPLFPGDTVHVRMEFLSKRESKSGPNGIVVEMTELLNENDEVVLEAEHTTMLIRRDSGHSISEDAVNSASRVD